MVDAYEPTRFRKERRRPGTFAQRMIEQDMLPPEGKYERYAKELEQTVLEFSKIIADLHVELRQLKDDAYEYQDEVNRLEGELNQLRGEKLAREKAVTHVQHPESRFARGEPPLQPEAVAGEGEG